MEGTTYLKHVVEPQIFNKTYHCSCLFHCDRKSNLFCAYQKLCCWAIGVEGARTVVLNKIPGNCTSLAGFIFTIIDSDQPPAPQRCTIFRAPFARSRKFQGQHAR